MGGFERDRGEKEEATRKVVEKSDCMKLWGLFWEIWLSLFESWETIGESLSKIGSCWLLCWECIKGTSTEAWPVRKLSQFSRWGMMMAYARVAAVEVVRSGQIIDIFWRKNHQCCLLIGYLCVYTAVHPYRVMHEGGREGRREESMMLRILKNSILAFASENYYLLTWEYLLEEPVWRGWEMGRVKAKISTC